MNKFEKIILKKKHILLNIFLTLISIGLYIIILIIIKIKYKNYYNMIQNPNKYAKENNLKCIHTKIVGVTFKNQDGSKRQEYLKKVKKYDELELIPYNYEHREEALGVFHNKKQIGNTTANLCYELIEKINNNKIIAVFATPTGGNNKIYGCNITIITKY